MKTAPAQETADGSTDNAGDGNGNLAVDEDVADDASVAAQPNSSPSQSWSPASSIRSAANNGDVDNDNHGNGAQKSNDDDDPRFHLTAAERQEWHQAREALYLAASKWEKPKYPAAFGAIKQRQEDYRKFRLQQRQQKLERRRERKERRRARGSRTQGRILSPSLSPSPKPVVRTHPDADEHGRRPVDFCIVDDDNKTIKYVFGSRYARWWQKRLDERRRGSEPNAPNASAGEGGGGGSSSRGDWETTNELSVADARRSDKQSRRGQQQQQQ
jgi:hypothetical protein